MTGGAAHRAGLFAAAALAACFPARAEVYLQGGPEADGREASMSKDPKVEIKEFKPHDLVTVKIKDIFKFKNNVTTNRKQEYDIDAELADWFGIRTEGLKKIKAQQGRRVDSANRDEGPALALALESERELKGIATQSDQMQLEASLTAEVVEVRPNGTLVLEARKVTEKDEHRQTIVFTGVARREDIDAKNAIDSDRIANPFLKIEHEGPDAAVGKRGWFTKILDVVWPF